MGGVHRVRCCCRPRMETSHGPTAVSADGHVVVGIDAALTGLWRGVKWVDGKHELIQGPLGEVVSAWAVNRDGTVIGGSGCTVDLPNQPPSAWSWTATGGVRVPHGGAAHLGEMGPRQQLQHLHQRAVSDDRARPGWQHPVQHSPRGGGIRDLVRRRARLPARLPSRPTAIRMRSRTSSTRARSPRCLQTGACSSATTPASVPRTAGASSSSFRSRPRSEAAPGVPERSRRGAGLLAGTGGRGARRLHDARRSSHDARTVEDLKLKRAASPGARASLSSSRPVSASRRPGRGRASGVELTTAEASAEMFST